ncbi:MAG: hypothetical protein DMF63_10715 [Acidobacteria bacterium]|nr:MAG: hypothetical protein DMF63_10715 [Acidobacteriota bacterium]
MHDAITNRILLLNSRNNRPRNTRKDAKINPEHSLLFLVLSRVSQATVSFVLRFQALDCKLF